MARSTLSDLLLQIRGMVDAGTADYTVGTVSYWSDDNLQIYLDRYRMDVYQEQLSITSEWVGGGTIAYKIYSSQYRNLEQTDGGTAVFYLEDGTGANVSTALYSPDYNRGVITFLADTGGSVYYLTGRSYNLNSAAADIWRAKSAHYAASVNFSTDNMRVERGALMANALKMAEYYDSTGGPVTVEIWRDDLWPG